jgi:hypothetical protein
VSGVWLFLLVLGSLFGKGCFLASTRTVANVTDPEDALLS